MPVAAMVSRRNQGLLTPEAFSFHQEYAHYSVFGLSIVDAGGPFWVEVHGWNELVKLIATFTETVAHPGMCLRAKLDIYRTGYGMVNGANIRVTPLS